MGEILSSFSKWFGEKTSGPLYWTYFCFLITWNWKFFQLVFFEDASLFTSPRVEYIDNLFYTPSNFMLIDWFINFAWHLVPPALFTYFAIVYLPRLNRWAFKIHLTNYFDRKTLFQEHKVVYEKKMANLTKQEAVAKIERVAQEKIIEKAKTEEEKWSDEFNELTAHPIFLKFKQIITSVYEHEGRTESFLYDKNTRIVDTDALAFVHSKSLVNIKTNKSNQEILEFTDKGKFFVSKYLEK